jgi:hypothetical protein
MMTPYFSDEHVTLWHGDCRDHTGWLEAAALVMDPPYGIDYRSNSRRDTLARSIENDKDTSMRDAALGFWRKANTEDAPALVFGTWRIKRPSRTRQVLIWDTKGALGMGAMDLPWRPAHQEIYVIGRGFSGHRSSDVLTYAPVQSMARNGREHPHQKPVPLMRDLIAKCPPGTIADPFAGSGSTLVAAKMLGRKAIGVELDERYCEVIAKRLSQGVLDFGEASA